MNKTVMSFFSKIKKGVSSNIYAQFVTIATQLTTLPAALTVWNLEAYGHWVVLTAIPAYFGMAELGMGIAAAGLAINALARNESEVAKQCLATANFMSAVFCAAILLLTVIVLTLLTAFGFVEEKSAFVIGIMAATNLLAVMMSVNEAAFRAADQYATGTVITTSGRLVEWFGFIFGLMAGLSFVGVAGCMFLARAAAFLLQVIYLRVIVKPLGWSCAYFGRNVALDIIKPSMQLSVFPLVSLISIQGITIVVGWFYGAAAAGVFNAYRTYSRISLQMVTVVSNPLLNWLTNGVAHKNYASVIKAYKIALRYSTFVCIFVPLLLYFFADLVFLNWTHGKIKVDGGLMSIFLLGAALSAIYSIPRAMLIAANRPGELTMTMLYIALFQLCSAGVLAEYVSVSWVVSVIVFGDFVLAWQAYMRAKNVLMSFNQSL